MKKNFIRTVVCTVVFCAVGVAAYFGMPKEQDNELLLANVEALTGSIENIDVVCSGNGHTGKCYRKGTDMKYCGEYTYYQCEFTGYLFDECYHPC